MFGRLASDEGFTLAYGNKSVTYSDNRGSFELGFEDGYLLPPPHQIKGEPIELSASDAEIITSRVLDGLRSDRKSAQIFRHR
ncbi:MAG: hypothetical protein WBW84_11160 [Acidobacteriaceae bacterium]